MGRGARLPHWPSPVPSDACPQRWYRIGRVSLESESVRGRPTLPWSHLSELLHEGCLERAPNLCRLRHIGLQERAGWPGGRPPAAALTCPRSGGHGGRQLAPGEWGGSAAQPAADGEALPDWAAHYPMQICGKRRLEPVTVALRRCRPSRRSAASCLPSPRQR